MMPIVGDFRIHSFIEPMVGKLSVKTIFFAFLLQVAVRSRHIAGVEAAVQNSQNLNKKCNTVA